MTIQGLAQDQETTYEGNIGCGITTSRWINEYPIDGDNANVLHVQYEFGVEVSREIKPIKVYSW